MTSASSQLHDDRIVPYIEVTVRGSFCGVITVPFRVKEWQKHQENIRANRGVPDYETAANSALFGHYR